MGNWLVNHWFSAAVLVSVQGWEGRGGLWGRTALRGLWGKIGGDGLSWGWAVGMAKEPLGSTNLQSPGGFRKLEENMTQRKGGGGP